MPYHNLQPKRAHNFENNPHVCKWGLGDFGSEQCKVALKVSGFWSSLASGLGLGLRACVGLLDQPCLWVYKVSGPQCSGLRVQGWTIYL